MEKPEKNEKREKSEKAYGLPQKLLDEFFFLPVLEYYRTGRIVLHHCAGLCDFTKECLGFTVEKSQIFIYGSELKLIDYFEDTAEISGNILRIEIVGR